MSIRVGILGASGYGGAGLIERLLRHPEVEIRGLGTRQHVGRPATAAWPQLAGLTDLTFSAQNEVIEMSDVVFCATPHRATAPLVAQARSVGASVIDLSADFRIPPRSTLAGTASSTPTQSSSPRPATVWSNSTARSCAGPLSSLHRAATPPP